MNSLKIKIMILPFSTQLNGKPTYFVEKIHKSFRLHDVNMKAAIDPRVHYPPDYNFVAKDKFRAKIHTIREDKKDRWKPGTKIDFFINCRQPNMFRFAPVLNVVSVQNIEIKFSEFLNDVEIKIDGKLNTTEQNQELAWNDGFENLWLFLIYFSEDFRGKIIHWTDKIY